MKYGFLFANLIILSLLLSHNAQAQQASEAASGAEVSFKKSKMTLFEDGKKAKDVQVELAFVGKSKLVVRKAGATLVEIPYPAIDRVSYEYNQRRRIGEGAAVMLLSPAAGAVVMFVKTKSHWLAVEYKHENQPKALVVRLDKEEYEAVLATAEAEMGKPVERVGNKGGIANPTAGSSDLEETIDYPIERVVAAAKFAMNEHSCLLSEEKPGRLECKRPRGESASGFGGEKVKITLNADGSRTRVKIETDKSFYGKLRQKNWSRPVFDSMMKRLASEKAER